jgi:hypothetical protein
MPALPRAAERDLARRRVSSGFELKNRRVHRLGRPHRIEIFAEERDLAACRPQEHYILVAT